MNADRSDESLMTDYAAGSAAAFDELFRRYESAAFGFFRRRVETDDRAADLYQELFLRLHRARDTFDARRSFRPWFFQMARNVLVDDVRRAFRAREVSLGDRPPIASEFDLERSLAAREEASLRLGLLAEDGLQVVVGSLLLGRCHREIARELGKSRDAVKQIASRALRRLRTGRTAQ